MFFKLNTSIVLAALVFTGAATPAVRSPDASVPEINGGYSSSTGDFVAWIVGQSQCTGVPIGPSTTNWCSRPFTLGGVSGYTFEGCGGGLWINHNGKFFANCEGFSESLSQCDIHTQFHCS